MKTSRVWLIWAVLGVCALTVFCAMGWLTKNTIVAGNQRAAAEARADLEERTRLALWRIDTLGAAIVLRENQYSAADYKSSIRSPFLSMENSDVLLHFQVVQGGGLSSPENDALNAQEAGVTPELIEERTKRMEQLRELLAANPLPGDGWAQFSDVAAVSEVTWKAVPKETTQQKDEAWEKKTKDTDLKSNQAMAQKRRDIDYQSYSNTNEYVQRAKAVVKNYEAQQQSITDSQQLSKIQERRRQETSSVSREAITDSLEVNGVKLKTDTSNAPAIAAEPVTLKTMRGAWLGGELFLLRKVTNSGSDQAQQADTVQMIQGVWLNAEVLKKQLLDEVADLLPNAKLVPASGAQAAKNPMALVSFPFVLDRNETIILATGGGLSAPLKAGWVAVMMAVIAAILLVQGIMRLSERRASFVSAVTHELRTPLTTFRLYSDMLESGAVKEEKRAHYLSVLTREADRLSHLVENVLAFSGIERGNARSQVREVSLAELVENSRERMQSRLESADMTLSIHELPPVLCRVDTAAVEHILFNLIDNAAKYAAGSEPAVVELSGKRRDKLVEISVCDHGGGIPQSERARIFQAFHKSAREAAENQPGVGLGLALSRRLAKSVGGNLRCDESEHGACFVLSLPLASGKSPL